MRFNAIAVICILHATFHAFATLLLPADRQVTLQLAQNQPMRLTYEALSESGELSATLITCESPVKWSLAAPNSNHSIILHTATMDTYHLPSKLEKGDYYLDMEALNGSTTIQIYISSEIGGPQTLQSRHNSNLRVLKRQKKQKITLKWNPSLVDPQCTDYCLVVSERRHSGSLCAAHAAGAALVTCIGRRTRLTLSRMVTNRRYYFDLFATNNQSNFTYPYGSASIVYNGRFRPLRLKDGGAAFANLRRLDGKAVFRYKVVKSTRALELVVVPCGGVIDVEVALRGRVVAPAQRVEGYKRINIEEPELGGRYYVKVYAVNGEEMGKTTGVEIYATTKPRKIPLPEMPRQLEIIEYSTMTTCDSVTIGWMVAPFHKTVSYCVIVKEGLIPNNYQMPNQCNLENRLKKSVDFTVKYCKDDKFDKEKAVVEKIKQLEPGKNYVVQVVVKKPKGKTLSYNLLQVRTKTVCKQH